MDKTNQRCIYIGMIIVLLIMIIQSSQVCDCAEYFGIKQPNLAPVHMLQAGGIRMDARQVCTDPGFDCDNQLGPSETDLFNRQQYNAELSENA